MPNPYDDLGPDHFWKTAVAATAGRDLSPRMARSLHLAPGARVATAGSCFAQNIGLSLRADPVVALIEAEALRPGDPVFSGRYGNVYTPRQLVELIEECRGGRPVADCAIRRRDGRFVDVHRPFMEPDGFATAEAVVEARAAHLAAIRPLFAEADLFVFTLGLTEAWLAGADGTGRALPVCPGLYSDDPDHPYAFHNFTFGEVVADTARVADLLAEANPGARLLLTVSPVPLTATYGDDHVLVATTHSKAVLRAACGELAARGGPIHYFPSYEMVANPYAQGGAFEVNLRTVRAEVVAGIMTHFRESCVEGAAAESPRVAAVPPSAAPPPDDLVCDDLRLEGSIGF